MVYGKKEMGTVLELWALLVEFWVAGVVAGLVDSCGCGNRRGWVSTSVVVGGKVRSLPL